MFCFKSSNMHVFLLDYIPRKGNSGYIYFSLGRNYQKFFSVYINPYTQQECDSSCSISLSTLNIVCLFNFSHFGKCVVGSHCMRVCVCFFYFEKIEDSLAIARKNTEIPHILYSFPPSGDICVIIAQYHNQQTDAGTILH